MQTRLPGGFLRYRFSISRPREFDAVHAAKSAYLARVRDAASDRNRVSLSRLLQVVAPGRPSWAPLTAIHVEPPDVAEQSFERLIGLVRLLGMGSPARLDHLRQVLGDDGLGHRMAANRYALATREQPRALTALSGRLAG